MHCVLQHGKAYGFMGYNAVFNVTLPANVTHGFVAYGTTSYGYADFDNLLIEDVNSALTRPYFNINNFSV